MKNKNNILYILFLCVVLCAPPYASAWSAFHAVGNTITRVAAKASAWVVRHPIAVGSLTAFVGALSFGTVYVQTRRNQDCKSGKTGHERQIYEHSNHINNAVAELRILSREPDDWRQGEASIDSCSYDTAKQEYRKEKQKFTCHVERVDFLNASEKGIFLKVFGIERMLNEHGNLYGKPVNESVSQHLRDYLSSCVEDSRKKLVRCLHSAVRLMQYVRSCIQHIDTVRKIFLRDNILESVNHSQKNIENVVWGHFVDTYPSFWVADYALLTNEKLWSRVYNVCPFLDYTNGYNEGRQLGERGVTDFQKELHSVMYHTKDPNEEGWERCFWDRLKLEYRINDYQGFQRNRKAIEWCEVLDVCDQKLESFAQKHDAHSKIAEIRDFLQRAKTFVWQAQKYKTAPQNGMYLMATDCLEKMTLVLIDHIFSLVPQAT